MQPRTLVIAIVAILGSAIGFRFSNDHFGWLPLSEEAILKTANAISVHYWDRESKRKKECLIADPAEVQEVLATLRVEGLIRFHHRPAPMAIVEFHFPNGESATNADFVLDESFYQMLKTIVSRHEGRPVNFFNPR